MNCSRRCLPILFVLVCFSAFVRAEPATPASARETRDAFFKIVNRKPVDLAPKLDEPASKDGYVQTHFTYASDAEDRVPGILVKKETWAQDAGPHPVVIALHGTGGKKEGLVGLLHKLAERGFIAIAIDGRYHGERGAQTDYHAAIIAAFEKGGAHPLYYDTVWDVTRLIDYLQTRPDVDAKRIGLIGFSKGGIETWLAAAVEPRIACAIPTISVQSFAWGLENNAWPERVGTVGKSFSACAKSAGIEKPDAAFAATFYDKVLPGIRTQFDGPRMLPLIAPRPLLIIGGDKDPKNPVPGLKLVEAATKTAYATAGASDKFEVILESDTGHNVTPAANAAAVEWFAKWIGTTEKPPVP